MKNDSKIELLALLIILVAGIAIFALSIAVAKWIAESDMPLWLKYWLLRA